MESKEINIKIKGRKAYVKYPIKYENYRGDMIGFLSHIVDSVEWHFIKDKDEAEVKEQMRGLNKSK